MILTILRAEPELFVEFDETVSTLKTYFVTTDQLAQCRYNVQQDFPQPFATIRLVDYQVFETATSLRVSNELLFVHERNGSDYLIFRAVFNHNYIVRIRTRPHLAESHLEFLPCHIVANNRELETKNKPCRT